MIATGHNQGGGMQGCSVVLIMFGGFLCIVGVMQLIIGLAVVWVTCMYVITKGHVTLVDINGTNILVPYILSQATAYDYQDRTQ